MSSFISSNIITDLLRTVLLILIEIPAYTLLKAMYQVFFNVASAEIFSSGMIKNFYYRIQLIIGVFMVFKLSITILQSIISPDKVSQKQTGMMSIIGRVFIVLILLTLITPIRIKNPKNEYEEELNNNGILFGTLYSLQYRILENDTIGKIVLGAESTDKSVTAGSKKTREERLIAASNRFSSAVLKVFVRINVVPKGKQYKVPDGHDPEEDKINWVCTDIDDDLIAEYKRDDADPLALLQFVNLSCDEAKMSSSWKSSSIVRLLKKIPKLGMSDSYAFAYFPAVGGIVAFILAFIFLGFSLDVAIRAVKLAALRLIAPIPIISYVNPSKDNGAFGAWVKNLTSTYLDLFIRLVVIHFVINLIDRIIVRKELILSTTTGFAGRISFIIIIIGLFIFAKESPKFIKDALGIKGGASNNIGLSSLIGGASMLAGGASIGYRAAAQEGSSRLLGALTGGARSFAQGAMIGERGAVDAYNQGKSLPMGALWRQNQDLMEQIKTGDKDAKGGIYGRMLDRLNYGTRDAVATSLGMSKTNFALADHWKTQSAVILGDKKEAFERARNDLVAWEKTHDHSAPDYASGYNARLEAVNAAYKEVSNWEVIAAKASSNADKIDKNRTNLGAGVRISDQARRTYRSNYEVIDNPTVDSTGRVEDIPDNYKTAAKPFKWDKGAPSIIPDSGSVSGEGSTHVDDDSPGSFGGGSGGGPRGPH